MTLYESAIREGGLKERDRILQSIVHNMLQRGVDYQTIADCTDLSLDEVALFGKKAS
jgi:hypothetical protein